MHFRKDANGKVEVYSVTHYQIEIEGQCECISVAEYEIDKEYKGKQDFQIYPALKKRKRKIGLPYNSNLKVLAGDRILLAIYSNSFHPMVTIRVSKEGREFYLNQWDNYLSPIYIDLDG
jgi:hypothetical protein